MCLLMMHSASKINHFLGAAYYAVNKRAQELAGKVGSVRTLPGNTTDFLSNRLCMIAVELVGNTWRVHSSNPMPDSRGKRQWHHHAIGKSDPVKTSFVDLY